MAGKVPGADMQYGGLQIPPSLPRLYRNV